MVARLHGCTANRLARDFLFGHTSSSNNTPMLAFDLAKGSLYSGA